MLAYLNECEFLCMDCAGVNENSRDVYDMDYQESDCPQHCVQCHIPLDNPLTMYGVRYVLDAMRDSLRAGREARDTVHECYDGTWYENSRHCEIVRDWAKQIQSYGGLPGRDESFIRHYLSWTER